MLQTAALIVAGIVLALVANAFASRERKMTLTGSYPNALKVPAHETGSTTSPTSTPPSTVLVTPQPAPDSTTTQPVDTTAGTATAAIETVGLNPAARNPAASTSGGNAKRSPDAAATGSTPATTPVPATTINHSPSPTVQAEEDPLKRFPPHPDKPYIEIAFASVKWLHDKNVLVLDARRTSVYEQGHIAGARTFSVWESDIDEKVNKLFEERSDPQAQALPIVIYCSGGDCEDSHMLAQKLWGIQFNDVYVYKDGFPDWQQHGGAIHTGAKP